MAWMGCPSSRVNAGLAALQFMIDLMPYTDPGSISYAGINDATNVLLSGRAAMMMNLFTWNAGNDSEAVEVRWPA